jgi:hypothetical protein
VLIARPRAHLNGAIFVRISKKKVRIIGAGIILLASLIFFFLSRQGISSTGDQNSAVETSSKNIILGQASVEGSKRAPSKISSSDGGQGWTGKIPRHEEKRDEKGTNNLFEGGEAKISEQKGYESRLKIIHQFFPSSSKKLVDQSGSWAISQTEKEARKVHSMLEKDRDRLFVYQDRKIFRTLNDSAIDRNLPICLLKIEYAQSTQPTDDNRFLESRILEVQFPMDAAPNFLAVRLVLGGKPEYRISPRYIDCGYLEEGAASEAYKELEFADFWATTGFRLVEASGERR